MLNDVVALFEQTKRAQPVFAPQPAGAVFAYLRVLKAWMRGNLVAFDRSLCAGRADGARWRGELHGAHRVSAYVARGREGVGGTVESSRAQEGATNLATHPFQMWAVTMIEESCFASKKKCLWRPSDLRSVSHSHCPGM
jgi:hypothetical protein